MLGTNPGDCIPYFDLNRFAELLVDGKEVQNSTVAQLNANPRAVALIRTAENDIVEAVRPKQQYPLQQLRDLVRDYQIGGIAGHQIVSLIADLAWTKALIRKRYPAETPQGSDPALKRSEDALAALKAGSRIFVIEGVQQTDGLGNVIGVYGGQEKPNAGLMLGHTMRSDIGRPSGVFGDVGRKHFFPHDDGPSDGWW